MAVTLNASTSTGLVQSADTSGEINLQSNGTTVLGVTSTGTSVTGTQSVSGNLSFNSGYGSSAVAYGCRAWVDFNGTSTVAIRGSGNVTSITDHGTGQYTVNLTTSLPDTNYAIVTSCGTPGTAKMSADINNVGDGPFTDSPPTVSSLRFAVTRYDSAAADSKYVSVAVFR